MIVYVPAELFVVAVVESLGVSPMDEAESPLVKPEYLAPKAGLALPSTLLLSSAVTVRDRGLTVISTDFVAVL